MRLDLPDESPSSATPSTISVTYKEHLEMSNLPSKTTALPSRVWSGAVQAAGPIPTFLVWTSKTIILTLDFIDGPNPTGVPRMPERNAGCPYL